MTAALKTDYDTLTTSLRRVQGVKRDARHYLEKWRRKRGMTPRVGGGKIAKFRMIAKYQGLTVEDVLQGDLPRVSISEYHFYRWNVGPLLCVYCGAILDKNNRTQDHVVPRCRGGAKLGRDNLEPACITCNSAKANKSLLMFLATR